MSSKKKAKKKRDPKAEPVNWSVHVGNIGYVYDGIHYREMLRDYSHYRKASIAGIGRAAGEPVTVTRNGEPHWEYIPPGK